MRIQTLEQDIEEKETAAASKELEIHTLRRKIREKDAAAMDLVTLLGVGEDDRRLPHSSRHMPFSLQRLSM
jgi:hypothetical protein